jgi:hypothetical protein
VKLDRNGLEVLDHEDCRALLGTETLGRIGVTVTGIASEVTDPDVLARVRGMPFTRWVRNERDRYVGISLDMLSGRRTVDQR